MGLISRVSSRTYRYPSKKMSDSDQLDNPDQQKNQLGDLLKGIIAGKAPVPNKKRKVERKPVIQEEASESSEDEAEELSDAEEDKENLTEQKNNKQPTTKNPKNPRKTKPKNHHHKIKTITITITSPPTTTKHPNPPPPNAS